MKYFIIYMLSYLVSFIYEQIMKIKTSPLLGIGFSDDPDPHQNFMEYVRLRHNSVNDFIKICPLPLELKKNLGSES